MFIYNHDYEKLEWTNDTTSPMQELTNEQATVIAVASMAKALNDIAVQLNNALNPLQEIADALASQARK